MIVLTHVIIKSKTKRNNLQDNKEMYQNTFLKQFVYFEIQILDLPFVPFDHLS